MQFSKQKVRRSKSFLLQWDGKMLTPIQHAKQKKEHIALLLHCLDDGEETIVGIHHLDGRSDAATELNHMREKLQEIEMHIDNIKGFVLDTTSVNSGIHTGVIVHLETYLGKRVLLLACRHHILEISWPKENIFHAMQNSWSGIDTDKCEILDASCLPRFVKAGLQESLSFLEKWVSSPKSVHSRKDYQELVVLGIILLGGKLPATQQYSIDAPGAITHSR